MNKINQFSFFSLLFLITYSVKGMEEKRLVNINKAIEKEDICAFFGCLQTVNYEWLKQHKKNIKETIHSSKLRVLGIDPKMETAIPLSECQKKWIKPFEVMHEGLECLQDKFVNEDMQRKVDNWYSNLKN